MSLLQSNRYWLKNAHVPTCLLDFEVREKTREGLGLVDIEVTNGNISQIVSAGVTEASGMDLKRGIVFPCFVDMHTHLDKGHIWERSPNPNGTFNSALETVIKDTEKYWKAEDVYPRLEFGLKCSYAHGTKAIRTHIDAFVSQQAEISFGVFQVLQTQWKDKIILQASSLVSLDYYQTPEGVELADKVAEIGGILGAVAYINPNLNSELDTIFRLAKERDLNLDFHVDETNDPNSNCLRHVAEAAIRNQFQKQIVCGHCCSLAVQSPEEIEKTLLLVKEANIGIVSLPMCNLFLQDRVPNRTPRWRGVTAFQEIQNHGILAAVASDNCRDPFYGFGDHDVLEVFTQAVRIAHLDTPYADSPCTVTKTPADLLGLPTVGRIAVGLPADLILFKARYFSELLSRNQSDRLIVRNGKPIDTTLPDYSELDNLIPHL